jgi:hypothetical protein
MDFVGNGLSSKWLILWFNAYHLETTDQKVGSSNLSGRTRNHKRFRLVASMALGGFFFSG